MAKRKHGKKRAAANNNSALGAAYVGAIQPHPTYGRSVQITTREKPAIGDTVEILYAIRQQSIVDRITEILGSRVVRKGRRYTVKVE